MFRSRIFRSSESVIIDGAGLRNVGFWHLVPFSRGYNVIFIEPHLLSHGTWVLVAFYDKQGVPGSRGLPIARLKATEDLDSHWNNFISECIKLINVTMLKELMVPFFLLV